MIVTGYRGETKPKMYILVGGKGSRLETVTAGNIPKSLIDTGQKPFLVYVLDMLGSKFDVTLVCSKANVNYFKKFKKEWVFKPMEILNEGKASGTAGWLRKFYRRLPESFYVMNGDTFYAGDMDLHTYESTIFVKEDVIEGDEGYVEGWGGLVLKMVEKNPDAIGEKKKVNHGIYKFYKKDLPLPFEKKEQLSMEYDILPNMKLNYKVVNSTKYDIGTVERLEKFEKWFR